MEGGPEVLVANPSDVVVPTREASVACDHPEEKESVQNVDSPLWESGFYIGSTNMFFRCFHIFIHGMVNEERRLLERGEHSTVYAIERPRTNGSSFILGVPYWFRTNNVVIGQAPDNTNILLIEGSVDQIIVHRLNSKYPNPVIRVTLLGSSTKFIRCKPIETHRIAFTEAPVFAIFKDQHQITNGGDFLLKIHGGSGSSRVFPYVEFPGGVCATLSLGDASKVISVDNPPPVFVKNVCSKRRTHLVFGCDDQARIPTISAMDLLLAGGLSHITNQRWSSRSEFEVVKRRTMDIIFSILNRKYIAVGGASQVENADLAKVRERASKIVRDNCIDKNHSTLVWSREGNGLELRVARQLCLILHGEAFSPQLIAICNGATIFAANDAFYDVNPTLFPSNEFDHVDLVDGCVNVSNSLPSGRVSEVGSANVVRYAIGVSAMNPVELWEAPNMFPCFGTVSIDGVTSDGVISDPDSDSTGSPAVGAHVLVVCPSRSAVDLRGLLRGASYIHSCEPQRNYSSSRWSSFVALPYLEEKKKAELNTLLSARFILKTTPSEYCRSSAAENGTAILQCGASFTFLKNNATALDILMRYAEAPGSSPLVTFVLRLSSRTTPPSPNLWIFCVMPTTT